MMNGPEGNGQENVMSTDDLSSSIQYAKEERKSAQEGNSNEKILVPVATSRKRQKASQGERDKPKAMKMNRVGGGPKGKRFNRYGYHMMGGAGAAQSELTMMDSASPRGVHNNSMLNFALIPGADVTLGAVGTSTNSPTLTVEGNEFYKKLMNVRKRRKESGPRRVVPDQEKDAEYYAKRKQNTEAARKCRLQKRELDERRVQIILQLNKRIKELEASKVTLERELELYKAYIKAIVSNAMDRNLHPCEN